MQPTPLSAVAVFRTRPIDHAHAAAIAAALQRQGQRPTQTSVLRHALATAAGAISAGSATQAALVEP